MGDEHRLNPGCHGLIKGFYKGRPNLFKFVLSALLFAGGPAEPGLGAAVPRGHGHLWEVTETSELQTGTEWQRCSMRG